MLWPDPTWPASLTMTVVRPGVHCSAVSKLLSFLRRSFGKVSLLSCRFFCVVFRPRVSLSRRTRLVAEPVAGSFSDVGGALRAGPPNPPQAHISPPSLS